MALDTVTPRTRRALLAGTIGGAMALAASALGRPLTGQAADGDVIHVGDQSTGSRTTQISGTGDNTFAAQTDKGDGTAIWGLATSPTGRSAGLVGNSLSTEGVGVHGFAGENDGASYGVRGDNVSIQGVGVGGFASTMDDHPSGHSVGVHGESDSPDGTGVSGRVTATSGENVGVQGESQSVEGIGVRGRAVSHTGETFGLVGGSFSSEGVGVYGVTLNEAGTGRGGLFSGGSAQIRLEPNNTPHPGSGLTGDLFADHEGALWFCKGGTDWKQIA